MARGKPLTIDDHLHDAKGGVAILATCIVQTINETDPAFQARFLDRLNRAYSEVREDDTDALDRLELLNWTRTLLTGFSPIDGQGDPFLKE